MNLDAARAMAANGRLYPSVILYGASEGERQAAAVELTRGLLCSADGGEGPPCGRCRHCSRIAWPAGEAQRFHPDFHVLTRDLKTTTSVDATKMFLSKAGQAPFEARGQVFVLAEAETLSPGAADALLKMLEEPPGRTPRHFFLLAASRLDLQVTLRSRSLAIFLGPAEEIDGAEVDALLAEVAPLLDLLASTSSSVYLLAAADVLASSIDGWEDSRARRPWATAAAVVLAYAQRREIDAPRRRRLLALAEDLLDAWQLRLRAIAAPRILEGVLARHLV